jgi:hypothetical protein
VEKATEEEWGLQGKEVYAQNVIKRFFFASAHCRALDSFLFRN